MNDRFYYRWSIAINTKTLLSSIRRLICIEQTDEPVYTFCSLIKLIRNITNLLCSSLSQQRMADFHFGCFSPHALRYICITHSQSLFYRCLAYCWFIALFQFHCSHQRLNSEFCKGRERGARVSLPTQIQMIHRITSTISINNSTNHQKMDTTSATLYIL